VAIGNALQLEGRTMSRQSFWAVFGRICTAHSHKLLTAELPIKILTSPFDSTTLIS